MDNYKPVSTLVDPSNKLSSEMESKTTKEAHEMCKVPTERQLAVFRTPVKVRDQTFLSRSVASVAICRTQEEDTG